MSKNEVMFDNLPKSEALRMVDDIEDAARSGESVALVLSRWCQRACSYVRFPRAYATTDTAAAAPVPPGEPQEESER